MPFFAASRTDMDPLLQFYAVIVAGIALVGVGALIAKKIGF